ncbi:hypothetical protein BDZ97DRAFT_48220 [Flammula alnicola]|nr:hypothetical protein BDZ97DRAFT_48220 [Flammula alnicola]
METSNKRALTEDLHESLVAADKSALSSGTPDDLVQRLRSAASRVRKNVTEGYRTTPSSFSKAQSTGSIFRSMNDTMQVVHRNFSSSSLNQGTSRKRARSVTEGDQQDSISEDCEMQMDNQVESTGTPPPRDIPVFIASRKIKPLRSSRRTFLEARSLPNGSLSFKGMPRLPPWYHQQKLSKKTIGAMKMPFSLYICLLSPWFLIENQQTLASERYLWTTYCFK